MEQEITLRYTVSPFHLTLFLDVKTEVQMQIESDRLREEKFENFFPRSMEFSARSKKSLDPKSVMHA